MRYHRISSGEKKVKFKMIKQNTVESQYKGSETSRRNDKT